MNKILNILNIAAIYAMDLWFILFELHDICEEEIDIWNVSLSSKFIVDNGLPIGIALDTEIKLSLVPYNFLSFAKNSIFSARRWGSPFAARITKKIPKYCQWSNFQSQTLSSQPKP
jgi:hypothetical protein